MGEKLVRFIKKSPQNPQPEKPEAGNLVRRQIN